MNRLPLLAEAGRLADIARVAAAKGWAHHAEGGTASQRFREALEELGPTFVKFGQMLSGRTEELPGALTAELARLHDCASPFSAEEARAIIEAETGVALDELFGGFVDEPLAAASMSQVHLAQLRDGTPVAVKVQRPGIDLLVESDIGVLRRVAPVIAAASSSLRALNLPALVEEFAETLREELDFEQEARNARRFAEANRDEPLVWVPRIFAAATTRRVLTMDYCPGTRLDATPAAPRSDLAQALMRLFLTQVFEHGVFHADPHPGNVLLLADGRLAFLDFGALGQLSPALQENLRQLFLAVMARDAGWLASAYLGMGGAGGEVDRAAFTRDLSHTLDRYYKESAAGRQSFSAILRAFTNMGRQHHIQLPREVALLLRAFAEVESLVRTLDAQFGALEAFAAYSPRLLKLAFRPELGFASVAGLYRLANAMGETAREAPIALRRLFGRLERGEPLFDIRHQSGGSLERHLLHASNRLAFALIVSAMIVGAALVIDTLPLVGIAGFAVAGALGAAWGILALRSGKL